MTNQYKTLGLPPNYKNYQFKNYPNTNDPIESDTNYKQIHPLASGREQIQYAGYSNGDNHVCIFFLYKSSYVFLLFNIN